MRAVTQKHHNSPAWKCLCGCEVPKENAHLSGAPQYNKGYHVHCPHCQRTVAQYVDPKETQQGATSMSKQKTKQYNVTNMTPNQRRKLFTECMNQNGFKAFIKHQNNQQTHYTFQYKN